MLKCSARYNLRSPVSMQESRTLRNLEREPRRPSACPQSVSWASPRRGLRPEIASTPGTHFFWSACTDKMHFNTVQSSVWRQDSAHLQVSTFLKQHWNSCECPAICKCTLQFNGHYPNWVHRRHDSTLTAATRCSGVHRISFWGYEFN